MRNKEEISIPIHWVGGQAALPSEQRKPKGSACLVVRSKDQSFTEIQADAPAGVLKVMQLPVHQVWLKSGTIWI